MEGNKVVVMTRMVVHGGICCSSLNESVLVVRCLDFSWEIWEEDGVF